MFPPSTAMQLDSHCPCSKGLSYDAKRDKMLELFHETSEVYNFKELEKLGPKKGVISQAVKEIIASLVADGLVTSEYVSSSTMLSVYSLSTRKLGSGVYYWSFPSQSSANLKKQHAAKTAEVASLEKQHAELSAALAETLAAKEETVRKRSAR